MYPASPGVMPARSHPSANATGTGDAAVRSFFRPGGFPWGSFFRGGIRSAHVVLRGRIRGECAYWSGCDTILCVLGTAHVDDFHRPWPLSRISVRCLGLEGVIERTARPCRSAQAGRDLRDLRWERNLRQGWCWSKSASRSKGPGMPGRCKCPRAGRSA